MCSTETTRICDSLQSIAIATNANPEFADWVNEVSKRLVHPSAITCTKQAPVLWLCFSYELGFDAALVAGVLNQRYQSGYFQTLK